MNFSPSKIRLLFNYSLLIQIGLGLILYLTFLVYGGAIFGDLTKTEWFELIGMATVWFYLVGLIYYIPAVILLNLIIGLIIFISKNKKPAHNKG